jgi:hypothetical protein
MGLPLLLSSGELSECVDKGLVQLITYDASSNIHSITQDMEAFIAAALTGKSAGVPSPPNTPSENSNTENIKENVNSVANKVSRGVEAVSNDSGTLTEIADHLERLELTPKKPLHVPVSTTKDNETLLSFDEEIVSSDYSHLASLILNNKKLTELLRRTDFIHPELRYLVPPAAEKDQIYLTAANKFGGDLAVYPGDPVRFHSVALAHHVKYECRDHRMIDLIRWGRVGHSARKSSWILSEVPSEDGHSNDANESHLQCISISWAGNYNGEYPSE